MEAVAKGDSVLKSKKDGRTSMTKDGKLVQ